MGQTHAARGHGLLSLAEACAHEAGLQLGQQELDALARLARDYQPTRYPDALPEGTPMGHYGPADSSWAIGLAGQVLDATGASWALLLKESDAQEDGP